MLLQKRSRYHLLGISILILICFHAYPWYQSWRWQSILQDQTKVALGTYPARTTPTQNVYLDYLRHDTARARAGRERLGSGSLADQYNFGTFLAIQSVTSGTVTDLNSLQQAERVLYGAVSADLTANNELLHNLNTVRALLQEQENNENNQQEKSGTDEHQQENTEQNNDSGTNQPASDRQQNQPASSLSESMKQQLVQYQQQLLAEQAQNQQFYDKPGQQNSSNNPFDLFDQLFGGTPQLDQQIGNEGEKDR